MVEEFARIAEADLGKLLQDAIDLNVQPPRPFFCELGEKGSYLPLGRLHQLQEQAESAKPRHRITPKHAGRSFCACLGVCGIRALHPRALSRRVGGRNESCNLRASEHGEQWAGSNGSGS